MVADLDTRNAMTVTKIMATVVMNLVASSQAPASLGRQTIGHAVNLSSKRHPCAKRQAWMAFVSLRRSAMIATASKATVAVRLVQ
jgi:hypothetical protein